MGVTASPENWISCRLGDLLTFEYGKSLTKSARSGNGEYPVFGSSGVVGLHDAYLVEGPVIIVGRKGAAGSVCYSETNCWPIDTTYYIRSGQFLNSKFVYYLLHSLNLTKLETSTAIPGLNRERAYDETVFLPPLAEQHRIVAKIEELFSELDQGVASLKTAREQLKVYRQSLLKNAFEGKLTAIWRAAHRDQLETAAALQQRIARERQARHQQQLADWQTAGQPSPKPKSPKPLPPLTAEELAELPELPTGWGWFKVGEICDSIVPNRDKPKSFSGDIPWITTPCLCSTSIRICYDKADGGLTPEEANRFGAKVIPVNSVVMTCVGTFGLGAIVEKTVIINQQLHAFLWSPVIDPRFLAYRVQAGLSYFEKSSTSTTIQYLNKEKCNSFPIPICCLEEQRNVVEELESKLSEADQLDQTLATALQQADALRQSILKKAFHGQLVKQAKNEEPATALLERIRAEKSNGMNAPRSRRKSG